MATTVWSNLSEQTRLEIIKRLDSGEKTYHIADEYNLHQPSLARKWRKIQQKRNANQGKQNQNKPNTPNIKVAPVQRATEVKVVSKQWIRAYDGFLGRIENADELVPNERFMFFQTQRPLRILFYTDTHFGQEDTVACDTFIRIAEKIPHDLVIHGGDCLECYGLSKYGKDPRKIFTNSLQQELKRWRNFSERLADVSDAPKFMIFGNHMTRYYDWLKQNPALMDLEEFQIDNLLRLNDFGYAPSVNSIFFDGDNSIDYPNPKLVIHHGTVSRRSSGNSSRSESELRGYVSSVSGHVHRLSASYRRTLRQQVLHAEGGTLRTLSPDWLTYPDWQHGCLDIHYSGIENYISANAISIIDGMAYLGGIRV